MVTGGRNVRMNRRQVEIRRKERLIKWIARLVRVSVLVMIVFCIRNIYVRLEEMQMELDQLEIQQYGKVQTSADAQSPDKLNIGRMESILQERFHMDMLIRTDVVVKHFCNTCG